MTLNRAFVAGGLRAAAFHDGHNMVQQADLKAFGMPDMSRKSRFSFLQRKDQIFLHGVVMSAGQQLRVEDQREKEQPVSPLA